MFHPLIQSLIDRQGFVLVDDKTLPELAVSHENAMLFVAGDPKRMPETLDVAVVAPEIIKAFGGRLVGFLASPTAEPHFQMTLGFNVFPALVFLRRGDYLGAITRIRDWPDYMVEIPQILARQPSTPPDYMLPRGCGNIAADASTQPVQ